MQVMRMSRKGKPRSIVQKIIEAWLALRYECSATKEEILTTYADNAPFGGNVVGLEAAAWRYFGTSPYNLTWSEAALLAVLPNAPALIHPGRNREALENKRNRLLGMLRDRGTIDSLTCRLAMREPLPREPLPLPNLAPHLADGVMLEKNRNRLHATLSRHLQERVVDLLEIRQQQLRDNEVHNMACLVVKVETGEVLAYVGNSMAQQGEEHGNSVDVIRAPRSSGSILKPILFAGMLDNGDILPAALVPDVPVRYNGYAPKNYDRQYEGAVPAYEALSRSLNIPSVIMLKNYGVDPFLGLLRNLGFSTFTRSRHHYGLTLILGGGETTLWELAGVYSSMARVLNHYTAGNGNYFPSDYRMPVLEKPPGGTGNIPAAERQEEGLLSASSIWLTFESLLEVNRPEELSLWYLLSSSRNIAWKTGTSYGFRDAWAVGVTPEYLVAVWAGNADGEGRPGLSGITAAAPLMFDVFSILPPTTWFKAPLDDLEDAEVCRQSGYLAGPWCNETDTVLIVPRGAETRRCPYHRLIHTDREGAFRVNSECYPVRSMKATPWFVLPPLMEWYYERHHPDYKTLPPVMAGCLDGSVNELEIVYPEWDSHLVIPRELDGSRGKVVLEVAHRQPGTSVFWHIDETYVGTTQYTHQLAVDMEPGKHRLTVVDAHGNREEVRFEVLK
jgi:penicillin-binding protein 1C